ncbi:MAG TPA: extracellular solute-binding protein [Bacillota bacterium]|nr:extracellular solute-binding protein [Bacillota bacterium]
MRRFSGGSVVLLVLMMVVSGFSLVSAAKTVTLRMPIYAQQDIDYFSKSDLVKKYQKLKPGVTIELEIMKDNAEFENAMKIRKAAGELPEIMPLKQFMLTNFSDSLLPLDDLIAAKNNLFPNIFNGKTVALPQIAFGEFVYYRKSIFKEYGLAVPKTWNEFISAAKKIKEDRKYIPIVLGAKDQWPVYPLNEFMPSLVAGDGAYWDTMAKQDEPFSKDKAFYKAYAKIKKLYDAKVFGQDPLGIGFDQAKALFAAGKGGMLLAGQWFIPQYAESGGDMKDLGLFLLPIRDKASEVLYTVAMTDMFLAIPVDCKYKKEAKEFIEWFFSKDYYPQYITETQQNSTIKGINSSAPILKEAYTGVNYKFVLNQPGGADFQKISDAIKFNVKALGQEMIMGQDLDQMMNELNKHWKDAKSKLK